MSAVELRLAAVPLRVRSRLLALWFILATLALLLPLPEVWQDLETSARLPLDKLAHCFGTALGGTLAHWRGWRAGKTSLILIAYSAGMEVLQDVIGIRAGDWVDLLFALGGLSVALVAAPQFLPSPNQKPTV